MLCDSTCAVWSEQQPGRRRNPNRDRSVITRTGVPNCSDEGGWPRSVDCSGVPSGHFSVPRGGEDLVRWVDDFGTIRPRLASYLA